MSVRRGGLGRNLSALLQHSELMTPHHQGFQSMMVSVTHLQPGAFQPRLDMDEASLLQLSESIKKQGLLQPLVVRELALGRYEIIAGERRWRACQLAGWTEVPVVLRQVDDETAMAMALVENLQREDLNPMDQARAILRLHQEFDLTHEQIATLLSKSRTSVSNFLRLMNLHDAVKLQLERGELDMGHARALLSLRLEEQAEAACQVVAKNLSVRETELLVSRWHQKAIPKSIEPLSPALNDVLDNLAALWQTSMKLKPAKAGQGQLIIHYKDVENLEKILGCLMET